MSTPNKSPDARLLRALQRLSSSLTRVERTVASEVDLSLSQLWLLRDLGQANESGMKIGDLARGQGLAVSTLTRNVALLEKKGWVVRRKGTQDRRTVWVCFTESGRELLTKSGRQLDRRLTRAFAKFHATDRVERAVALDRVASALDSSQAPAKRS